jgi:hypothetical protein
MVRYSPQHKHDILSLYRPRTRGCGFHALATRFAVRGGGSLLRTWYQRWNGTVQSLQPHHSTGRPRALTPSHVSRDIRAPLLAANRSHRAVHYTTLLDSARARSGTRVSIQTVRRMGQQALHAKQRRTVRRTSRERELNGVVCIAAALLRVCAAH